MIKNLIDLVEQVLLFSPKDIKWKYIHKTIQIILTCVVCKEFESIIIIYSVVGHFTDNNLYINISTDLEHVIHASHNYYRYLRSLQDCLMTNKVLMLYTEILQKQAIRCHMNSYLSDDQRILDSIRTVSKRSQYVLSSKTHIVRVL